MAEILAATAIAEPARRAFSSAATASQASALRDEITTLAPCSASRSAIARPMPRDEPVTTATLPLRSKSSICVSLNIPRVRI